MTSVEPFGIANWQKGLKHRKIRIQYFISPVQNVASTSIGALKEKTTLSMKLIIIITPINYFQESSFNPPNSHEKS